MTKNTKILIASISWMYLIGYLTGSYLAEFATNFLPYFEANEYMWLVYNRVIISASYIGYSYFTYTITRSKLLAAASLIFGAPAVLLTIVYKHKV